MPHISTPVVFGVMLLVIVGLFFFETWIWQLLYNFGVPTVMASVNKDFDQAADFKPIGYFPAMALNIFAFLIFRPAVLSAPVYDSCAKAMS